MQEYLYVMLVIYGVWVPYIDVCSFFLMGHGLNGIKESAKSSNTHVLCYLFWHDYKNLP